MTVVITQGSNSPLEITVDMGAVNAVAISVELFQNDQKKLSWDKSDITFEEDKMLLPLTESDTLSLSAGRYILDGKYFVNGRVQFLDEIECIVVARRNKTKITE